MADWILHFGPDISSQNSVRKIPLDVATKINYMYAVGNMHVGLVRLIISSSYNYNYDAVIITNSWRKFFEHSTKQYSCHYFQPHTLIISDLTPIYTYNYI